MIVGIRLEDLECPYCGGEMFAWMEDERIWIQCDGVCEHEWVLSSLRIKE